MGFLDKLKNTFFEEEIVEVEEPPKKVKNDKGSKERQERRIKREVEEEKQEENEDKRVEIANNLETKVIDENNITASFTDTQNDIQVKNQSKYDIKEILQNPNYELKNKDKIIIYHTHTCESYSTSEKYNYEMTGAYRTTDLNFSVAKVRR